MKLQRRDIILVTLMLIGLAMRCWFIAANVIDPRFSAADDGDYYQRALRFAATGEYVDNAWLIRPPLHVMVFSAILWVCINLGETSWGIPLIRVFHLCLSMLSIPIGYGLARRLFNQRAGYAFAAMLAIWFPMVELPALILSEPLFLFFSLLHLYLLVRWRDERELSPRAATISLLSSGAAIGLAALARSPALYCSFIAMGWIVLECFSSRTTPSALQNASSKIGPFLRTLFQGGWVPKAARWLATFAVALVLVLTPWTIRNWVTYGQFIPTDTLGPVNLWLALTSSGGEGEGKVILASLPQEERQEFVNKQIAEIISNDPTILLRNLWPHFQHMWKAQFIEDFFVKASFYTRPLREIWPMGALGDVIWLVYTVAGLITMAVPASFMWARSKQENEALEPSRRLSTTGDGWFRLLAIGWIVYTTLIVILIHIEPRYLLPVWLVIGLYGSWLIADWRSVIDLLKLRRWNGLLAIGLVIAFVLLFFSYRDYPTILARGLTREHNIAEGYKAYNSGDYQAAEAAFARAVEAQPGFIDARTDLALSLVAQGRYDEALEALGKGDTHRANVVRGEIARVQGRDERAKYYFTDTEFRAGEDIQKLTLDWLRPPRTNRLTLGTGLDFGYVYGFSPGEILGLPDGSMFHYRWLQGDGIIRFYLTEPLQEGSVLTLRMAGGYGASQTPLTISMADTRMQLGVDVGIWRNYEVPIPAKLVGQDTFDIKLEAPTFIPGHVYEESSDTRPLSLMISTVWVE